MANIGIFILPEGELESLVRDSGKHGPSWVAEVLSTDEHKTAVEAHDFVRKIAALNASEADMANAIEVRSPTAWIPR